jgi:hypothetical protein
MLQSSTHPTAMKPLAQRITSLTATRWRFSGLPTVPCDQSSAAQCDTSIADAGGSVGRGGEGDGSAVVAVGVAVVSTVPVAVGDADGSADMEGDGAGAAQATMAMAQTRVASAER